MLNRSWEKKKDALITRRPRKTEKQRLEALLFFAVVGVVAGNKINSREIDNQGLPYILWRDTVCFLGAGMGRKR